MSSKSVREGSTVCTWCGNNQSEKADWCLVSRWVQLGNGKAVGDEGWWCCLCFVCADEKSAWGSRLFGSRKLWHKVNLLLDNLMWCIVSLSSQVFSHLTFLLFWFVWEISLCYAVFVCGRERMFHEVSHRICCCCSDPPKFFRGPGTSLSLLKELSGSPNTCSKRHTLDNLVEFNVLGMLCYHRSKEPCPCCCHQHGICFCLEQLNFICLSLATFSDTAMLWNL